MKKLNKQQLKDLWFDFFGSKGYKKIGSASLIPENDATVLFTTAGMHPLVPYLLGEKHPAGNKLMDVQKCIRTNDIDEVGDSSHCTFFEMLGNWTLGDCDKRQMVLDSFEFLTSEKYLAIDKNVLNVSVFAGDDTAPRDVVSYNAWLEAGIPKERIFFLPKKNNWWELGGGTGPCGSDTEMFIDTGKPKCCDACSPACDCGKYLEIWNDVFMEYNVKSVGDHPEKLAKPNIDTGLGLERTVCILNGVKSVYDVGAFKHVIDFIESKASQKYDNLDFQKSFRIIADHLRATTFVLGENKVVPATTGQGYILRRFIRRSLNHARKLSFDCKYFENIANIYIEDFKNDYPELKDNQSFIIDEIQKETQKFEKTIEQGQKEFEKVASFVKDGVLSGKTAFRLYDTYGFPLELTVEMASEKGLRVDIDGYNQAFQKHQELSRAGAEQLFKGGLADTSKATTYLHTATHLLLAGLRKFIRADINQKGSNITPERLRVDFNFDRKLTADELKIVEDYVNDVIKQKIPVVMTEMPIEKARELGAIGVFDNKYGENVKVYTIGQVSKEICGGPHAENTSDLVSFKIIKEESSSSGVRRIKAVIEGGK